MAKNNCSQTYVLPRKDIICFAFFVKKENFSRLMILPYESLRELYSHVDVKWQGKHFHGNRCPLSFEHSESTVENTMVSKQYKLTTFGETKRLLSINEVLCYQLSFKEKLYVFNEDGVRTGRFSVSINTINIKNRKALIVHISNIGVLGGRKSQTIVTGILTLNLKTLEEIRYESSEMQGGKHERRFYLLRERTKYYYSVTESVGEIAKKRQKTIPFAKTTGLMGEASNIVFMRAIAIRGYQGIVCLKTVLSNGKRCRNYYVSKLGQRLVNGIKMEVVIIYRSVTDHKKCSVTSTCTFTRTGQMIDLFWSNSLYFLHIDPDLEVYERMIDENKEVGLHRHWNRDKQIFSYYLDQKFELEANSRSFRLCHQEIKRVMADWLQLVLLMKPQDIFLSAKEYFSAFCNKALRKSNGKTETISVEIDNSDLHNDQT